MIKLLTFNWTKDRENIWCPFFCERYKNVYCKWSKWMTCSIFTNQHRTRATQLFLHESMFMHLVYPKIRFIWIYFGFLFWISGQNCKSIRSLRFCPTLIIASSIPIYCPQARQKLLKPCGYSWSAKMKFHQLDLAWTGNTYTWAHILILLLSFPTASIEAEWVRTAKKNLQ